MKEKEKYTVAGLIELTSGFVSRTEFQKAHGGAYWWAKKRGFLNDIFPHLANLTPRGYWSDKSNVLAEAKKYRHRGDFKVAARQAYNIALKNNWLEVFEHFESRPRATSLRWKNKESVMAEASKYRTAEEFRNGSFGAWTSVKENNWDDVFLGFDRKVRPAGYWSNYENCRLAALECQSKLEMRQRFRTGYETIKIRKWDELFSHMTDPRKGRVPHNIGAEASGEGWNVTSLKNAASQYASRKDFMDARSGAYKAACEMGVIDEICSHMKRLGNHFMRYIYAIEFEDKSVYIGLTFNLATRKAQHERNSSNRLVREKILAGVKYRFIESSEFFSREDAPIMELAAADDYRIRGYVILNIAKLGAGGSLGGGGAHRSISDEQDLQDLKWSKSKSIEAAKNSSSRSEFHRMYSGAWRHAKLHGYLEECQALIPSAKKPNGFWNDLVNVRETAKKCHSRSEFKNLYALGYRSASNNGILDELFPRN